MSKSMWMILLRRQHTCFQQNAKIIRVLLSCKVYVQLIAARKKSPDWYDLDDALWPGHVLLPLIAALLKTVKMVTSQSKLFSWPSRRDNGKRWHFEWDKPRREKMPPSMILAEKDLSHNGRD